MKNVTTCFEIHSTMTDMSVYAYRRDKAELTDTDYGTIAINFTKALNESDTDENAMYNFWDWLDTEYRSVCDEDEYCDTYVLDGKHLVGIDGHGLFVIGARYSDRW